MVYIDSNGCYRNVTPNYGMTELLAENIDRHPLIWLTVTSVLFSIGMTIYRPSLWYIWIVSSPFICWQAAILLLVLYVVETIFWWILHPNVILYLVSQKIQMTDTRFKWLAGCASVCVMAIAAMIIFKPTADTGKQKSEPKKGGGEYVYVDRSNILHIDRKCSRLNYKGMTSRRVKVSEISTLDFDSYCPKCVDDQLYQSISTIINHNKTYIRNERLCQLYDALMEDGAPLPSFATFEKKLLTSRADRREVYEALKADGVNVGETLEEFERRYLISKDD